MDERGRTGEAELQRDPRDQKTLCIGSEQVVGVDPDHRPVHFSDSIETPDIAPVLRAIGAVLLAVVFEDQPSLRADEVEASDEARIVPDLTLEPEVPRKPVRLEEQSQQRLHAGFCSDTGERERTA